MVKNKNKKNPGMQCNDMDFVISSYAILYLHTTHLDFYAFSAHLELYLPQQNELA